MTSSPKGKGKGNKTSPALSFEDALKRLEEIVRSLESAELTLEESLKLYNEGITLAHFCSQQLEQAEKQIEMLLEKEDGSIKLIAMQVEEAGG